MRIGELYYDEDRPTIDGDWIRGVLVLGRVSKNPADTDGTKKGISKVTRKFNIICESQALYSKFDGCEAHIGPHKMDGAYPDDAIMGSWHNPVTHVKGLRMDIKCRKIGEAYHPQAAALRDHVEHNRPFGGFSPLFDGDVDYASGEVTTVDAVSGIDWVPAAGSVKSIMESEADETFEARHVDHEKRLVDHETRIAECEMRMGKKIAEALAKQTDNGVGRAVPPPELPPGTKPAESAVAVDPFTFCRT